MCLFTSCECFDVNLYCFCLLLLFSFRGYRGIVCECEWLLTGHSRLIEARAQLFIEFFVVVRLCVCLYFFFFLSLFVVAVFFFFVCVSVYMLILGSSTISK